MPRSSHPLRARDLGYAQRVCVAKAGKLMMRTGQLSPRARVGLAVSGGVDSLVMLAVMAIRRRIVPFPVELMLLHLNPGFDPHNHAPLVALCAGLGIPLASGTGGSNMFGNDYFLDYRTNEMAPDSGGSWGDSSSAGVWALGLAVSRAGSSSAIGFRSALYL